MRRYTKYYQQEQDSCECAWQTWDMPGWLHVRLKSRATITDEFAVYDWVD